jgi:F0F1-type ATP synthase membrane subunit b/b'
MIFFTLLAGFLLGILFDLAGWKYYWKQLGRFLDERDERIFKRIKDNKDHKI